MTLDGKTVLITGGASGIGLAFAQRFLAAGHRVIVCGRRERALRPMRIQGSRHASAISRGSRRASSWPSG